MWNFNLLKCNSIAPLRIHYFIVLLWKFPCEQTQVGFFCQYDSLIFYIEILFFIHIDNSEYLQHCFREKYFCYSNPFMNIKAFLVGYITIQCYCSLIFQNISSLYGYLDFLIGFEYRLFLITCQLVFKLPILYVLHLFKKPISGNWNTTGTNRIYFIVL